ncbi:MAG: Rrf2 family transcriptional regulator [Calditrichae bacterium]|nr:Rrf2 family transcriptional regulator [Calditrichota bacterium]MCB9059098.1 Rrf2 family transcriptional regulator [Calditrichia bacterium]
MLSNATVYGIRAVIYIAAKKDRKYVPISEISEKLKISFHFLTKILQKLTQRNILISNRGPQGGIAFNRPPDKIYIAELVDAIEGADLFDRCVLGLPGCGVETPCPMHDQWTIVKVQIKSQFEKTTVSELAKKVSERNERL